MSKILILDDHATNRELLVKLLGYKGHHVLEGADGGRGLDLARSEHPDLVIADVLMPVMDGYEFVRRLRSDPSVSNTPVVFYTANYLEREARLLASRCGVNLVITKPAEPETILETVDLALMRLPLPARPPAEDDFAQQHTRLLTDKLSEKVAALQASSQRLTALVQLGRTLAVEPDPQRLVSAFCHEAREIVGSRCAAVGIFADSPAALRQFAASGGDTLGPIAITAPARGLFGAILSDAHPLRLMRLDAEQAAALPPPHARARSFLGARVATGTQTHGWVYFIDKLGLDEFTEQDEEVASLLCAELAVAYENARRLEKIQQYAAELERRVEERTEALSRSNADLAKFAYIASHDLQEPLRMVASYTELLARRYKGRLDADADDFIGFAVDGARRMQELIRDLLAYSRIDSTTAGAEAIPLDTALDQAIANLRQTIEESGATINRQPLPVAKVVPTQFVQVFQNLIANAIKFRGARPPEIDIDAEREDDEWVISVRDNGIGIAPEFHDRIFVIFQRLHPRSEYPGTGMGLAICQRIVERHGGRLRVRSAEGDGSTFLMSIPSRDPKEHEVRAV